MLGSERCGRVRSKSVHNRVVGHITMVELEISHGDATIHPIWTFLNGLEWK
jgi:ribosomal protein S17E